MRNRFDEQLALLNTEMIEMGALCEKAISGAVQALMDGDRKLAADIIAKDTEVKEQSRSIEGLCLKLLLQQQPVARDLRQISAALKMITDMERIGEQTADVCDIIRLETGPRLPS